MSLLVTDHHETVGVTSDIHVQWNLIIRATYGPNIYACYIEVAALQRCKCIEPHHLGLQLGSCIKEVTT